MKKTKKLLSVLMATIICISSFAVCNLSAYAAGWIDTVQEIEFDSVYTESCSKSDASSKNYYYDAFMFNVPTSGKIKLTVEAESIDYVQNWFYNYYTPFSIYDVNNLKDSYIEYNGEITIDKYGRNIPKHAHGTQNLDHYTSSSKIIGEAVVEIFERIINSFMNNKARLFMAFS